MMNPLRGFICLLTRGYRKGTNIPYRRNRCKRESELYPDVHEDGYDFFDNYEDMEAAESDFQGAGQCYNEYQAERRYAKEILKKRIVERKYFKSKDPVFLTWIEKHQIQTLHEQNSSEWTPEVLSESFPVLPETINKILRAKWSPKSVEDVIRHDQKVIDNWKQFKKGGLALDPKLEKHLEKYKNRELNLENIATIADKLVQKPPTFQPPKSNTFTNVIKDYNNTIEEKKEQPLLQIRDKSQNDKRGDDKLMETVKTNQYNPQKLLTFDVFLEKKVQQISHKKDLSLENKVLFDEYKRKKEHTIFKNDSIADIENKETAISENKENQTSAVMKSEPYKILRDVSTIDTNSNSLSTGVLEWKRKEVDDTAYPQYIKVPLAKAKLGVTFKVQDRYYDSDGEFLYRVVGLKR